MCGIAGIVNHKSPINKRHIERMLDCLRHRGPDDSGIFIHAKRHVGLGQRRLSIIDLSPAGHQPMCNEDGTVWITFNGEIYNYSSLRSGLQNHQFRSQTDTEVILHLYEEKGIDAVQKLEGMFAFGLWDSRTDDFYLVRDRTGEKPLVFSYTEGTLYFASEIPAILAVLPKEPPIDIAGMHHYFTHSYLTPPPPLTLFEGIQKVPPAHIIHLTHRGSIRSWQYWNPEYKKMPGLSEKEYTSRYLSLLEEVVQKELMSDVPLGVMLSGGIDSSSIVAVMKKLRVSPLRSYAIGAHPNDPELIRARQVAQLLDTQHTEVVFNPQNIESLPLLLEQHGEPLNLLGTLYIYELVKKMREEVKVVLAGSGADEVFGGYDYYRESLLLNSLFRMTDPFRFRSKKKDIRIALSTTEEFPSRGQILHLLLKTPPHLRKGLLYTLHGNYLSHQLYTPELQETVRHIDTGDLINKWFSLCRASEYIEKVMFTDLMIGNLHSTVIFTDIAGMSKGLEIRSPFLHHHLIEFAAALPVNEKIHSFIRRSQNKYIMKRAMEGILPSSLLYNKKMGLGYNIRWSEWMRTSWKHALEELLLRRLPELGYFNMEFIQRLLREHMTSKKNHGSLLMGLMVFALWHELVVRKTPSEQLQSLLRSQ